MKTTATLTLLLAPLLALAQNAFTNTNYQGVAAGKSLDLTWGPTTGGTVTLVLRSGDASDLNKGMTIASNIPNNGMYKWNVPSDITKGSNYAVEIVADGNSNIVNYTPQFAIDSTNTAPMSMSSISAGSSSSTSSMASSTSMPSSSSSMTSSAKSSTSSASASSSASSTSRASSSTATTAGAAAATTSASTNGASAVRGAGWSLAGALLAGLAL